MTKLRRTGFWITLGIVLLSGWTYYKVSAPRLYNSDGTLEWTSQMKVERQLSRFPAYRTLIGFVERTGGIKENGIVTRKNDWITFRIWNGYGIKDLTVRAATGTVLLSGAPGHPSVEDIFHRADLGAIDSDVLFSQTDTYNGRHYVVTVPAPAGMDSLLVTVTDKFGNLTSGVIRIPPDTWHDDPPPLDPSNLHHPPKLTASAGVSFSFLLHFLIS